MNVHEMIMSYNLESTGFPEMARFREPDGGDLCPGHDKGLQTKACNQECDRYAGK
jgi:hypothetical protein